MCHHNETAAEGSFNVSLLVAGRGAAQTRGYIMEIEVGNRGGGAIGYANGSQKRNTPGAAACALDVGLAAPAEGGAKPWEHSVEVEDRGLSGNASGEVLGAPLRVPVPAAAKRYCRT